jgi:hypothetical protein
MPAQALHTEGFVLTRRPAADPFQSLVIFTAAEGPLHVLQRTPRRPSPGHVALDLFDEVALVLESGNQGRTWFVKEVRLLSRALAIARSYEALRAATSFALLIARNPVLEESRGRVAAFLRTAIEAFSTSDRPDIVAFKCLYRFARDEGHPVRQQWFPMLAAADREAAEILVTRPLAGQTADPAAVAGLHRRLEEYLAGHTEMIVDIPRGP